MTPRKLPERPTAHRNLVIWSALETLRQPLPECLSQGALKTGGVHTASLTQMPKAGDKALY